MAEARPEPGRGPRVQKLSPGPSPRLRWGERVPLQPNSGEGLVLDLSEVKFAGPTLALRLAASEAVHKANGVPFAIVPPREQRVRSYLARAGLAELMGVPPPPQAKDVLMPVTRIPNSNGVEPVAAKLQTNATALPGASIPSTDALTLALSELGANACSHGRNDHGTFVLAQRLGAGLVLAVGDMGEGIPDHLGKTLPVADRREESRVIARALERGVSGVGGDRGNGLPQTLETIREAGMAAAELCIWSGVGRVSVQMRARPALRHRVADVTSYTPGAWVEVVLASAKAGST